MDDGAYHFFIDNSEQAARDRLYHLWFYDYARSHEMTLYSDSVTFKQVNYYAGILMRHDHPLHDMILSYLPGLLETCSTIVCTKGEIRHKKNANSPYIFTDEYDYKGGFFLLTFRESHPPL